MSAEQFYDSLADTYHALYPDWGSAARAQGKALHRLLSRWHAGPADIADVACGIGTQLIGLACLGHRLFGADISSRAVRRARRECAAAGVPAALAVADMRELPLNGSCVDAVICADNALPHLLTDGDVLAAPPSSTLPQVFSYSRGRIISFQLWTWREGTGIYDLEHFQVHEQVDGARTTQRRTATYRAYTRAALTGLAFAADLHNVAWHMPDETNFFQPIMTARKPAHRSPP